MPLFHSSCIIFHISRFPPLASRIALALLLAGVASPSRADELAEKGRDIFKKHQHAVVTVQVVLKMSYSGAGRSSENRQDLTGTVVDPSGLTVLALSACDPSEMYQRMMSEEAAKYKLDIEVTDIKILLDDGTEIPCRDRSARQGPGPGLHPAQDQARQPDGCR